MTAPASHPRERTDRRGRPNEVHTAGAGYFDELRAAMSVDPPAPWHPALEDDARRIIEGDHGLGLDGLATAVADGEATLRRKGLANDATGNGWGTRTRGADFGADVLLRAATANFVLAAHHPAENRSYNALHDSLGGPLDGRHALTLTFPPAGEPPCTAFWSLTVCGPDMYLVANEIDRWATGDRTGLRRNPDASLTLTIGGSGPRPDSNWLPAPDGRYRLGLRVYEGSPDVVNATWFPPPLLPAQAR